MWTLTYPNQTLALVACLTAPLLLAACSNDDEPRETGPVAVAEVTKYARLVGPYETLAECRAATAGEVFNCEQSIVLCPNGAYILVVTDIVNEGSYVLDGDDVRGTQQDVGDGAATFTLRRAADGTFTSAELGGRPWRPATLDAAEREDLVDDCAAIEGRRWWRDRK